MPQDSFLRRKKDILNKLDKSSRARQNLALHLQNADTREYWDKKIINLCEKINSKSNYYTTSSCSGRIVLIINQDKKETGLIVKNYHNLISFEKLKKDLEKIIKNKEKKIKFKQEPCIIHVACKNLENAQKLLNLAKLSGWKQSGIISSEKRFIVEINGTEKLEFPIIEKRKLLISDEFLKIIIQESNKNLNKSWKKINKLSKVL